MSQKNHRVKLSKHERQYLQKIVESGKDKARKITRCRILLLADEAKGKTDEEISDALGVCLATIFNIRRRYHRGGLERAIQEAARSGQPSKFNGKSMAKITAIACSKPPEGHARWSLRLLADSVVELDIVESISYQSIRNILKKTNSSLT
ncbi:MAG: helix-turn-helix domain-containing protein [Candidatus Omnitrophica bacterium]|nr:helix-turn-helix domain-containing protein [Candidatus Omnitrophota bacterium]